MGNDCGSADGSAWYVPASQDSFCNVGWFGGALPQGNYEITWDIGGGGGGAVGMWVDSRGVSDPVTDVRVGPGRRTIVGHWNNSGTLPISPSFYIVYRGSIWQDWMRIYSVTIRRTS